MTDAVAFGLSLLALGGLVGVGEWLHRRGVSAAATRRLVHAGVGMFVAASPMLFTQPDGVYLLAVLFVGFNAWAWRRGRLASLHRARRASPGTVTFPLAVPPALALTWSIDPERTVALTVAFLVLALADPAAAAVGERRGGRARFEIAGATRSAAGTAAFFAVALLVTVLALTALGDGRWTLAQRLGLALLVAGVTTPVEVLGGRGWDNFFIVLAAVVVLVVGLERPEALPRLLGALGGGVIFGVVAWRVRFLDPSGAIAGGLLAASLVGLGGWAWAVPAFAFFVLSSLLSRIGRRRKAAAARQDEKGHVRDAGQVYANGGVGWACLLLAAVLPASWAVEPLCYVAFLGAFAAATADTWATEIGTLVGGTPRSLRTGRPVPVGTSGAVSAAGTAGAVLGAGVIAAAAWPVAPAPLVPGVEPVWIALAVVAGGFGGALVDSLLGATVQARYREAATGRETERAVSEGRPNDLLRGRRWMTNDRVNLLATAAGAVLALACAAPVLFGS